MKPFLTLLAMGVALIPATLGAQEAPSPPADPLEYNDAAMHFRAPAGYVNIEYDPIPLEKLPDDLTIVDAWVLPGNAGGRKLGIQMAAFTGDLDSWEAFFKQQIRSQVDDAVFKDRVRTTLKNGMPAYFEELTLGSGFDTAKGFMYLWIDGARGVAILANAKLGDLDAKTAKLMMSDASAVRYPRDRN